MVEVYARPLQERFIASRWSLAYLFRLCWYIALAIAPIYIAYSSGGFWKRTDTLFEQPMAKFTKSLICVGLAADGTRVIQYSTIERFNYMIGYDKVKQPTLTSWYTDSNLDSKPDSWDVNLVFPLQSSDPSIVSVSLFLFWDVQFYSALNLQMNGLMMLSGGGGGAAGNKLQLAGDLEFHQRNPLAKQTGKGVRDVYNYPLLNESSILGIDDIDLGNLMLRNEERNETVRLTPRSVWSTAPASPAVFNVSVHITIPAVPVIYIPGPSETLKFAWIQWLAAFWILYFGLTFVRDFVYSQNMVDTLRAMDGTPMAKLHQF